jgi:ABC-type sugar transport system substrate-binding protein
MPNAKHDDAVKRSMWHQALIAALFLSLTVGLSVAVDVVVAKATSAGSGKKVALLMTATALPWPAAVKAGFLGRAASYGMEVTNFDQMYDTARQVQQVDDAIARKFDLIAVMPVSEQAILPALLRAKRANIPVVIVNSPPTDGSDEYFQTFIGEDAVEMGRLSAESMVQALKDAGRDTGKIALITGSLQEGVAPRRLAGIKQVLATHPNAQIVAVEDVHWDPVQSERVTGQLLARFAPQGGLDIIYGMNDDQTVAIIHAAEAANVPVGLKPGQVIIIGGNCSKQGLEMIEAGKQYSTGVQVPARTGAGAADLVNDYFEGKPLKKYNYLPVETITKANASKWEKNCTY